ncbi:DUF3293 domain-containing protein [Actinoallomurus soli]|uniref:DUF3293 domain-containing protein n=1 Tax=Actinoallomurus soli TaxID=2952535 RepID=UPI002093AB51|nr:DUF3293 domain-containing protein [Actinoallomurus soli]MCO5967506.1 DUF3293 domain-containing protein [Actinoallomurus soli]
MEISPAALGRCVGRFPDEDGRTVHIITAVAPGREARQAVENEHARRALESELRALDLHCWPAMTGDSARTPTKPSVAVVGLDDDTAREIGRRFGQEAVFAWSPSYWRILACSGARERATGWTIADRTSVAASVPEDSDSAATSTSVEQRPRCTAEEAKASLGGDLTIITSDITGRNLTAIPRAWAHAGAAARIALTRARTYGQVRATRWAGWIDEPSHTLFDYYSSLYSARHPETDLDEFSEEEAWGLITPSDEEPFDLDHPAFNPEVEGLNTSWEARPHLDTDEWMPAEIAQKYGIPDSPGWCLNGEYEPAKYLYPTARRDEIEQTLRDLGFTVVHDDALIDAYWNGTEYPDPEVIPSIDQSG